MPLGDSGREAYRGVTERAFRDGLEQGRLPNVCQAHLMAKDKLKSMDAWMSRRTYDTALETVPRSAQQNFLLFDRLLRRHLSSTGEVTRRDRRDSGPEGMGEDKLRSDRGACRRSLKSSWGRSEDE